MTLQNNFMHKLLPAAIILLLVSCSGTGGYENYSGTVRDNAGLLSPTTAQALTNCKRPDNLLPIVYTVNAIPQKRVIQYADSIFAELADQIKDFRTQGALVIASQTPALVQMRVGKDFDFLAGQYQLYPGKYYLDAQQRYAASPDSAVIRMFGLALQMAKVTQSTSKWRKLGITTFIKNTEELLVKIVRPSDSFWFKAFFKLPYKAAIGLLRLCGSLLYAAFAVMAMLFLLSFVIWKTKSGGYRKGKLLLLFGLVLANWFVAIVCCLMFLVIAVPAAENIHTLIAFGLADSNIIDIIKNSYHLRTPNLHVSLIFIVIFTLYMMLKDTNVVVLCCAKSSVQQQFYQKEADERRMTNAFESANGTSVDVDKQYPYQSYYGRDIATTVLSLAAMLPAVLFVLNMNLIIMLITLMTGWLVSKFLTIFSGIRSLERINAYETNPYIVTVWIPAALIAVTLLISIFLPGNTDFTEEITAQIPQITVPAESTASRRPTGPRPAQQKTAPQAPAPNATTKPPAKSTASQRLDFDDGYYVGETKDGKPHGKGKYFYSNGSWADGNWADGGLNGQAICYNATHKRTDRGQYKDNCRTGRGRMEWADGDWYEGEWNDNGRHGQGVNYFAASKRTERGRYKDDRHYGNGTITWEDGRRYEGTWSDDENGNFNGSGTFYYTDGTSAKGHYTGGKWQKD
ncbi:MAG: hypothetical protein LBR06_04280 [Bacteroidales bacterium]|jgi:hypothetical protein|nr:hypothetical protein [Bacteroidales bacterium]